MYSATYTNEVFQIASLESMQFLMGNESHIVKYIPLDCVICLLVQTICLRVIRGRGFVGNAKLFAEFFIKL